MFRRRPNNRKHHYTGDVFKILYQNRAERPEDPCSVLQEEPESSPPLRSRMDVGLLGMQASKLFLFPSDHVRIS